MIQRFTFSPIWYTLPCFLPRFLSSHNGASVVFFFPLALDGYSNMTAIKLYIFPPASLVLHRFSLASFRSHSGVSILLLRLFLASSMQILQQNCDRIHIFIRLLALHCFLPLLASSHNGVSIHLFLLSQPHYWRYSKVMIKQCVSFNVSHATSLPLTIYCFSQWCQHSSLSHYLASLLQVLK